MMHKTAWNTAYDTSTQCANVTNGGTTKIFKNRPLPRDVFLRADDDVTAVTWSTFICYTHDTLQ